ncbi:MAG: glycosyltransferase [Candidatus Riflebacteria bacterium]|nr:glycosyltransferase [Candidatus Riflebacteria bacterium]
MKKHGSLNYLCLQVTREGQASFSHVHEIVSGLRKRGWHVRLFQPEYYDKALYTSLFIRFFLFLLVQIKVLFSRKADVYYFRWHFALFPIAFLLHLLKIPVIQEINGTLADLYISYPWTMKLKCFFRVLALKQLFWAKKIVAVTPQLCTWANRLTKEKKSLFVSNCANAVLFNPNAKSNLFKESLQPYVIFFGSLTLWQGIDVILEATNSKKWPSELKLLIIGNGVMEKTVEDYAKRNPLIIFWNSIPQKDLAGMVAKAVAGLSSKHDSSKRITTGYAPLKAFEIMASQVPIIVSDTLNLRKLAKVGAGMAVSGQSSEELAETINYLYSNPEICEKMGKIGRKLVLNNFTWDIAAEKTHKLISEIIKEISTIS